MKFIFSSLLFIQLCVACPFRDCEDDLVVQCNEPDAELQFLVRSSFPYANEDVIEFTSNTGEQYSAVVAENENNNCPGSTVIRGDDLTDVLFIRTIFFGEQLTYRHFLGREPTRILATLDVTLDTSMVDPTPLPNLQQGQRVIADTVFNGQEYSDVLATTYPDSNFLTAVYLTQQGRFLQFDYANGSRLVVDN